MALARRTSVWAAFAAGLLIGGLCVAWQWSGPQPAYAAERISLADLAARVADLEELLAAVSLEANGDLVIEGVNLHVRSGSGATDGSVNGAGNLIVGYNEFDEFDDRSGSHNLVVGMLHSYSSFGGLIAGEDNALTGAAATVSGGRENEASGDFASVSGGFRNTASSGQASVSGGLLNEARGINASVSGGGGNLARGVAAAVSGGRQNEASDDFATVSGGFLNTASGAEATVSGGAGVTANSFASHAP